MQGKSGGARRDRTADLNTASVALSQLSYGPLRESAYFNQAPKSCQAIRRGKMLVSRNFSVAALCGSETGDSFLQRAGVVVLTLPALARELVVAFFVLQQVVRARGDEQRAVPYVTLVAVHGRLLSSMLPRGSTGLVARELLKKQPGDSVISFKINIFDYIVEYVYSFVLFAAYNSWPWFAKS